MWEAILDAVFYVIQLFYQFCGDWGLAIVIVTVIFRALITPLMFKQSKSTYETQKMQPLMKQIQERFADDPVRQNEEIQRLYAEAKFNPLAGCVPMLIQMPIFIALFQVLRDMGARTEGTTYEFYNLVPNLVLSPSQAISDGFGTFVPYLILMIVFAGATFLPMVLQQLGNDNPQKNQMLIMSAVMSLFMLWISWSSPAGVLLFWGTSSLLAIAQQQISMRIIKKQDAEKEEVIEYKPVEVNVTRKQKKKRPTKKR